MAVAQQVEERAELRRQRLGFWFANVVALGWALLSGYIARIWAHQLGALVSMPVAIIIIIAIAVVPGYMNILLLMSLLVYRYRSLDLEIEYPPVTILIAAYNEEAVLRETFRGIKQQDYPGPLEVVVVDDGSRDRTLEVLEEIQRDFPTLKVIRAEHGGKSAALNRGLQEIKTEVVVTIDADTFLYRNAVQRIVARLVSNPDFAAVAGHVLAKNERMSRLARMQAWDYMLAIAAVKRQQSFFQGTLVAQGSFSAFRRSAVEAVRGWRDRIGEDIVLTWALIKQGHKISYEPTAFAFTNVPVGYRRFARQRERWARGMIEGFKDHFSVLWRRPSYTAYFIFLDLFFPVTDFFYSLAFIPGLIMALVGIFHPFPGRFAVVGPMTLLVLPITLLIILVMFATQRRFLQEAGIKIRRNRLGLVLYGLIYQILLSPVCTFGYFKEFFGLKPRW
jgi:biofilm PGA synthesis N-glycosyltransferase PgaC